ncbi:MAG: chromosomal replication initiator DnaA [Hyphomonadaceae bacterium]|nr:chromosomal replication initiator DnaA [Hyphomonadaceae bacterium]
MDDAFEARLRLDTARARVASEMAAYALGASMDTTPMLMRGGSKVSFSRQAGMYLCQVVFGLSYARVGNAFGRDRTTVSHACRLVEARRDDPVFEAWIDALESALRETPAPLPSLDPGHGR